MTQQWIQDRAPLLTPSRNGSFIRTSIESNQQRHRSFTTSSHDYNEQEDEDEKEEVRWLAELRRRPWRQRPSSYWLIPWLIVLGINEGMTENPMEQLKIQVICQELLSRPNGVGSFNFLLDGGGVDQCKTETVLGIVSLLQARIHTVTWICIILTLAKWCSLSDIYGRRFLFQAGMAGIIFVDLINLFATTRFNVFGSNIYYLEAIASGLLPLGQIINPAIFAYCSDCTSRTQRSVTIGRVALGLAMGQSIGGALGAYLVRTSKDLMVVIRLSLILTALLSLYLSVIPESLRRSPVVQAPSIDSDNESEQGPDSESTLTVSISPRKRSDTHHHPWTFRRVVCLAKECLAMMIDPIALFLPHRIPKSRLIATSVIPTLILLACFLFIVAFSGVTVLLVTMTNLLFHWTSYDGSVYMSFTSFALFVIFIGILPTLQAFYKAVIVSRQSADDDELQDVQPDGFFFFSALESIKMDIFFSAIGMCSLIISYLLIPLFATVSALYVAGVFKVFGHVAIISNVAVLTSMMPSHLTGAVVGALSVTDTLARIVADLFYGPLFAHTLRTWPLFYYYVSAGLVTLALLVQSIIWRSYHHRRA